ncbi:MAG: CHAT domain-containing protein [Planctomycetota bacterium]
MDLKKITLQYIADQNDNLRVTSFGPLAETTIKTFEEFPYNKPYLKSKTSEILGLLRHVAEKGSAAGGVQNLERMKVLGEDLFRELIPVSFRTKLEENAGGDLLIYMDESLVPLPWELLYDGRGFFCRRFRLGRFVNTPPLSRRVERRRPRCPVHLLSIADPQGNLPAALAESRRIKDGILNMDGKAVPVVLAHKVRQGDFFDNLRQCDVLHFAGHVEAGDDGACIRFIDGAVSASQITKLAGRFPFPSLVFLNGCRSSEVTGKSFTLDEGQARTYDLASSFLLCGSRHYLGSLWDVHDAVAGLAGETFFRAFLSGLSVGSALGEVRDRLMATFGELSMAWAGYVLYGDPGFCIEGLPEAVDPLWREIMEMEERRAAFLEALAATEPIKRFVAALALLQLGDERGLPVIVEQFDLIYEFLRSPNPQVRQRGAWIVKILAGTDLGYRFDGDETERERATDALKSWRTSEAGKARLGS